MTTTLLSAEVLLSKQLGDYWSSTTTSAGAATSLVDTALMAKENDWITDETWAFLIEEPAGAAAIYDERKASTLDNSDGTLTTLAFGAAPGTGIDYELHRLFSPSEKRRALVHAAKHSFPHLFKEIWDESKVSGNWLKDGSFEIWTSSSALTYWTASTSTIAKTTSSPYYKHGKTSCKLSTAAGYLTQTISNYDDLKYLAGKTVTFTVQGYCATASTLRIAIYDGTTTTYSSYRTAESAWTENNDPLEVQATIQDNPTAIEFRIYLATANDAYVDDARVICGDVNRTYIGDLGLVQNRPHQVLMEHSDYSSTEPWVLLRDCEVDKDGYLHIPARYTNDRRLRIRGIGYLDFYDSSDVVGTDWEDTVAIDSPQTEILVAEAAIYLCNQMIVPNQTSGTIEKWKEARAYWKDELRDRRGKFGMVAPAATAHYGR